MRTLLGGALVLLASLAAARAAPPATAFVFVTTDCPIANRYAPEIQRLYRAFAARGVEFRLVYVNPRQDEAAIRAHARTFGYGMAVQRDAEHTMVRRYGITVTPEVVVVDGRDQVRYSGRIDDRYAAVGVDRQRATTHDFEDALTAVVNGRAVAVPSTRAVGCFVADLHPPTFSRDIAPIVYQKCAGCHRAGGPGPFSLTSYTDVRQRASLVAHVTRQRFMPPYRAVSGAGEFVGQPQLTADEIATLSQWAAAGAPEGDRREAPPAPVVSYGWQLGTPDLVVTTAAPFTLGPGGDDVFRIFALPIAVARTQFVTGLEFRPGNARVVHHANIRLDRTSGSRDLDARDPAPGYDGLLARSAVYPDGHFLGWTPGQVAPLVSGDLSWRLDPGTDLVVQLHMQPTGATEVVQPEIGLYFSDTPPTTTPTILRLGSQGLDIPPGEAEYRVHDSYVLPVDARLHAVQPHAHYRLRQARGTATLPDGSTTLLIEIDDWDFRWQHVYRFAAPVTLPRGTRIAMDYRYDNSAANPRNPQVPAQRVLWGQRSFDEMGDLWFQFTTASEADRARLNGESLAKMSAEDLIGYETMLRANPGDRELHDDAAVLYLSMQRPRDAVAHFRRSAELEPEDAVAQFNLATALTVAGDLDAAARAFRGALALKPGYAAAANNLGSVLAAQGLVVEAIAQFRAAVAGDPANVQAHRNLAWHLAHLSERTPEMTAEAVAAAETAARLTRRTDPHVLDALAAAYTAAGRREEATAVAAIAKRLRHGG